MIGRILASRYLVEQSVGTEGPADLCAGRDVLDGAPVLIWIVDGSAPGHTRAAQRLLEGAQAVFALNSERIPRVLETGEDSGTTFVVVEKVDGSGLDRVVKGRGRLSAADAIGLIYQALTAIAAAHGAGVIHGGIEPRWLVLRDDGLLKVCGLEAAGLASSLVRSTSAYCAPEVKAGGRPDARSDLFSLGVVLYEILSGRLPYDEDEGVETAPTPLRLLRPDAPMEMEALIDRVLARDPDLRPQSASDMSEALEAAMEGKPFELAGPIEKLPSQAEVDAQSAAESDQARDSADGQAGARNGRKWPRRPVLIGAAAVALLLAGGAAFATISANSAATAGASLAQAEPTAAPKPAAPTATVQPTIAPTAVPTLVPTSPPTLTPTAVATRTATAMPSSTPIPNPVLASIGAKVQRVRLFESDRDGLPLDQRQYATRFAVGTTRFMNYEVDLAYPDPKRLVVFGLRVFYYDAAGTEIASQLQNARIEEGWTQSYHWNGFGWSEPGQWKPGQYRLDVYDATQKIATTTFEIY